jgi:hypothetical protein
MEKKDSDYGNCGDEREGEYDNSVRVVSSKLFVVPGPAPQGDAFIAID